MFAEEESVAEEVEPELAGGAVGDVGAVGLAAGERGEPGDDGIDGEAELAVERAQGFGVALGEVVVGGGEPGPLPCPLPRECGEGEGEGGDEGFAFARLEFDDGAAGEEEAGADLDLVEGEAEGLLCGEEDEGEQIGEGGAGFGAGGMFVGKAT